MERMIIAKMDKYSLQFHLTSFWCFVSNFKFTSQLVQALLNNNNMLMNISLIFNTLTMLYGN